MAENSIEICDSENLPKVIREGLNPLQLEFIDAIVRMVNILGMPKSVGQIYGLLYSFPEPLCMDHIMTTLKISLSGASQGLKTLRSFRAIRTVMIPGDRRDFFEAEESFKKLFSKFLQEEMEPHFDSAKERIGRMEELLSEMPKEDQGFYNGRIDRLRAVNKAANRLLPIIRALIKF
jgi:DNA-binding transcriptional regulator GbsR (MarR family)